MMSLMTPLALCDVSAGTNGVIWPIKAMLHLIWIIWPKEWNGATDDAMDIM